MLCNYIPQQRSDLLANIGEGKLRNQNPKAVRNWHILTGEPAFAGNEFQFGLVLAYGKPGFVSQSIS